MPKFWELLKFGWDPEGMKKTMKDAKLVFMGRPNNPTGDGADIQDLYSLLSAGKPVIMDEAYAEFSSSSAVELLKEYKNLVILRTLSKAFGLAGLRVGYAVGDPDVVQALEKVRAPFNVNCLAQAAAVAALHDIKYMQKVVNIMRKLRGELYGGLSELGMKVFPSDANFIMADVTPLRMSAPELCDHLAKEGVYIRDLSGFRGAGTNYVRITVGKKEQNTYLISALKKILKGGKK
jgi:histidinol-phosphate aminotransferase